MLDFESLDYSNCDDVVIQLNEDLLDPLIIRYNSDYATGLLYHLPSEEDSETKPEAFRGRIGLLVEYALVSILHEMVEEDTKRRCSVTFNTANMFADFFIRNNMEPVLRIDVKAFHRDSDEASARFDAKMADIDPGRDYLLVVRWEWGDSSSLGHGEPIRYPKIHDATFVSCLRLAEERDLRQREVSGGFDIDGEPLTKNSHMDTNFGKMNRIVSPSRSQNLALLDPYVRKLYEMVKDTSENSS